MDGKAPLTPIFCAIRGGVGWEAGGEGGGGGGGGGGIGGGGKGYDLLPNFTG